MYIYIYTLRSHFGSRRFPLVRGMNKRRRYASYDGYDNERSNGWITFLWGEKMEYIVDALMLGTSLAEYSQWPRVLYCTREVFDKAPGELLRTVWEIEFIKHLDGQEIERIVGAEKVKKNVFNVQSRLKNVWTKLKAWMLTDCRFQKAILLDTDMLIHGNPDSAFFYAQSVPLAGVMRGARDGPLDTLRGPGTIKSRRNPTGGGINGGFGVFQPSTFHYENMVRLLAERGCSAWGVDSEQGLLSEYFAGHTEQLPRIYNFQVHQLTLSAPLTSWNMEWRQLIEHLEDVLVFHFSAIPKPINFVMGTLNKTSVGHMADTFPGLQANLQNCPWRQGIGVEAIAAHHDQRRRLFSDRKLDDIWMSTYHELYSMYDFTFHECIWPSLSSTSSTAS